MRGMDADRVSLIVAIVGLLVAIGSMLFSAYHQYWKRADLSIAIGDRVRSFKSSDKGRLGLSLPITFFNDGAQVGAIVRMVGKLTRPGGHQELRIRWDRFEQAQELLEAGRFVTRFGFGGFTDSVLVPSRGAIPFRIQFLSDEPFSFIPGDYGLFLEGYSQSADEPVVTACLAFTMTEEATRQWENTLAQDGTGVSKGAIEIKWVPCPAQSA